VPESKYGSNEPPRTALSFNRLPRDSEPDLFTRSFRYGPYAGEISDPRIIYRGNTTMAQFIIAFSDFWRIEEVVPVKGEIGEETAVLRAIQKHQRSLFKKSRMR
jgi:hypothetical protein